MAIGSAIDATANTIAHPCTQRDAYGSTPGPGASPRTASAPRKSAGTTTSAQTPTAWVS